jgi:NAD+ kinase
MGSLGFLCPFDFDNFKTYVNGVINGGVPLILRSRLRCHLEQRQPRSSGLNPVDESMSHSGLLVPNANSSGFNTSSDHQTHNHAQHLLPSDHHERTELGLLGLNEVVVSRGPSPFLSNLDLYVNDYLITTVQGDGLIISTPTGSTAYAMAAGASMNHPSIPAIIIAPICPHSLSFRPITVPAAVELKISLSPESRTNAWFSIDGRCTTELTPDTQLCITTSEYPLPSICRSDQINDWVEGLAMCLHWNQRQKQLPLNECYLQQIQQTNVNGATGRSLNMSLSQSQLHSSFSSSKLSSSSSTSSSDLQHTNKNGKELNTGNTGTAASFSLDEE